MKKDKNKEKYIINKREIELLNKYYEIDNENKIVTMPLHYESASSLINNKIISKDNYLFDYDELSSINEMINRVPVAYKINIDIQIDDYEEYEPEKLLDGFNDAMELNQYNLIREKKWKYLKAGILLLVGVSILFLMAAVKINNWFGAFQNADVYTEIFDIVGWVFIWETVTIAFLTPSELSVNSNIFRLRVVNVSFSNNEGKLVEENLGQTASKWETERRLEKLSRWALLFSGVAFIALGVLNFIGLGTVIDNIFKIENPSTEAIVFLIIVAVGEAITGFVEVLGGIATLCKYLGRKKFRKFSNVFSVLVLFVVGLLIYLSTNSTESFVQLISTFVVVGLYFFGFITNIVLNKNKK